MQQNAVRVGFIGLGKRGLEAVGRFMYIDEASVDALCDISDRQVAAAQEICRKARRPSPSGITSIEGWRELCELPDIDLVYITAPWQLHAQMACYAMENGKDVAVEVPAALTVRECWALVETAERTKRHCMMLENCVYDDFELTVLNMARNGKFGDVVHCEGGYRHQIEKGRESWREEYNRQHRGDLYPTHGLGPVARILGINHGDRMETLVSMDTDPFKEKGKFTNGDQTCTLIRTAKGKTILLQHNVITPQPYSRGFTVVGTDGYASKYPTPQMMLGDGTEPLTSEQITATIEENRNPVVLEGGLFEKSKKIGRHDGMDYIMDWRLIHALSTGAPLDMDVYDAAAWCSIIELSEQSIEAGNTPVEVPDFTRGNYRR